MLLEEQEYSTFKAEDTVIGSYRTALAKSIRQSPDRILYCDLDRTLHWGPSFTSSALKKRIFSVPYLC